MPDSRDADGDAGLERRPEATAYAVDDILSFVLDGRIRTPHFQRGMRWNDKDRVDLFDSLYRGFPIGTLLLWRRRVPAARVRFGELVVEAKGRPEGLLLVDGQQRVTTLARTLALAPAPGARTMLFDLEDRSFVYGRAPTQQLELLPADGPFARRVPVFDLFSANRLVHWFGARRGTLSSELIDRGIECGKRLREYRVPAYVVETDDEDVLRRIFDRVNRTGRRLDDADVFTALFATVHDTDESLDVSLKSVAHRVALGGFGQLDDATVLKALRAVCDLPLDRDFAGSLSRADAGGALERTEAALVRAVRFLRVDARIPHVALCPYELPVVVLAKFFDAFPDPAVRNRVLLRRWLWRGALGGALTGATIGLRQHVSAVDPRSESLSVQALLRLADVTTDVVNEVLDSFSLAKARSRLTVCALTSLLPRDLTTGETINLGSLFSGSSVNLPKVVSGSGELRSSVANRLVHETLGVAEIGERLLAAQAETLESHAVSNSARTALARGDSDAFLALRAESIQRHCQQFFRALSDIGADDSPPLDSLVVDVSP